MTRRLLIARWRKYGTLLLFYIQLIALTADHSTLMGCATLGYLTVPCGIQAVCEDKVLWRARQAVFALLGVAWLALP